MIVFLVGFMGSGKSYMAKQLAKLENGAAVDLDDEIEKQEGKTINEIFKINGEEYFRMLEAKVLRDITNQLLSSEPDYFENGDKIIRLNYLACGGGSPCFNQNIDWMNEHGLTIWVDPPLEVLLARLINEKEHRPIIKDLDEKELRDFVDKKREDRVCYYSQAKIRITDPLLPKEILNLILNEQIIF